MGGGFGEPILTMLSAADAIGQIRLFRERLRRRYNVPVRGLWLTERIWEAQLAGVLAKAGVEYSVVDDFHFRAVGLREEDLTGYYVTEDQGKLLRMFSGSEFLRYAIPFREPAGDDRVPAPVRDRGRAQRGGLRRRRREVRHVAGDVRARLRARLAAEFPEAPEREPRLDPLLRHSPRRSTACRRAAGFTSATRRTAR